MKSLILALTVLSASIFSQVKVVPSGLENLEIDLVLKDRKGNYIVYFDGYDTIEKRIKYDGLFVGTKDGLFQIEEHGSATVSSSREGLTEVSTHIDGIANGEEIGEASINYNYDNDVREKLRIKKKPFINCGKKVKKLKRAQKEEWDEILAGVKSGKIPLHYFPVVREPIAILREKSTGGYIYAEKNKYQFDGIRVFAGQLGELKEVSALEAWHSCHSHPKDDAHLHSSLIIKSSFSELLLVAPSNGLNENYPPYIYNKKSGDWNETYEGIEITQENLEKLGIEGIPAKEEKPKNACDQFFGK